MTIMISGIPIDIHKKNIKNMYLIVMTVGVALTVIITQFVYNIDKDRGSADPIDIEPDPAPENFE